MFLAVLGVIVLVVLIMVGTVALAGKVHPEPDGDMALDEAGGFGGISEDHPYGVRSGPIEGERTADEVTEAVEVWRDRWSDFRMC